MQDQQTPKNTPPESPYAPWANLIIEICDNEEFCAEEMICRFWGKYTLPEATLPLYQMLMAAKADGCPGTPLPYHQEEEASDSFFRDLCAALIAFSYITKFKKPNIVIVKPQTPESDAAV